MLYSVVTTYMKRMALGEGKLSPTGNFYLSLVIICEEIKIMFLKYSTMMLPSILMLLTPIERDILYYI